MARRVAYPYREGTQGIRKPESCKLGGQRGGSHNLLPYSSAGHPASSIQARSHSFLSGFGVGRICATLSVIQSVAAVPEEQGQGPGAEWRPSLSLLPSVHRTCSRSPSHIGSSTRISIRHISTLISFPVHPGPRPIHHVRRRRRRLRRLDREEEEEELLGNHNISGSPLLLQSPSPLCPSLSRLPDRPTTIALALALPLALTGGSPPQARRTATAAAPPPRQTGQTQAQ